MQKMSEKGKIFLAGLEGVSLKIYLDSVNVRTISVGVTKTEIPNINEWPWDKQITMREAMDLFEKALGRYEKAVLDTLKVSIPQHKFDALVSICYNIGVGGLKGSTFMKRINAGASDDQVGAAMMMWTKAGGKVLKGLVNRRTKEVNLYKTGNYGDGTAVLIDVNPKTHKPIYKKTIKVSDYL
jgi:lysozyme